MIQGTDTVRVGDAEQLGAALLDLDAVRLVGSGSTQSMLPEPGPGTTRLCTGAMNRILRLEADDLTCSVEPGVLRADLDTALEEHGLWLPCRGGGTLGGLFAGDPWGPSALAQPEPRSLLLGFSAILTDGTRFKAGARVVKNVAGFDLPKLFVGSRGRLFAVTEMHLKLRPRPAAVQHFCKPGLTPDAAIELTRELRRSRTPPQALCLSGRGDDFAVAGTIAGDARYLEGWITEHQLTTCPAAPADLQSPAAGLESVRGQVPLARVADLLARLPGDAPFVLYGARFWTHLPPAASDQLLAALPGGAEIGHGTADRRGRMQAADPAANRIEEQLKTTLDPRGVLR